MKLNKYSTDKEIYDALSVKDQGEFIICEDDETFDRVNRLIGLSLIDAIRKCWDPNYKVTITNEQ